MANLGQKVSLGLEPRAGATVSEVLNDLDRNALGRLMLPNLIVAMPIPVVVRLRVPAWNGEGEVLRVRLAWDDARVGERRVVHASLTLPSRPSSDWEALVPDAAVVEHVAILMAARAKKEAIAAYDLGDIVQTKAYMAASHEIMASTQPSPEVLNELELIAKLQADLEANDGTTFRKRGLWQAYTRKHGKES